MSFLLERDALNGKEGRALITVNGRQKELFGCKNVKVDYSLDSSDFKVVGTRLVQKKTTGIQLTGSMTIVYGTPTFKEMVRDYMRAGTPPYFTLQVTNNDPATSVGIQTIVFYNCRLNSGNLAQLDADADFLTEDIGFDFTSFEILSSFHDPDQLGGGIS